MVLIDQARQAPTPHNNAWPEDCRVDQQFIDLDGILYNMASMLGTARKKVSDFSNNARQSQAYEHAYHEERKTRIECARAYEDLRGQHNSAIKDLHSMRRKCLTLHQELEKAQEAMHSLESAFRQQQSVHNINDAGISQSHGDRIERDLDKERLEARVAELENEKSEMAQAHYDALANAADHIRDVTQKAEELEKLRGPSCEQVQPLTSGRNVTETDDATASPKPNRRANRARKQKQASQR